MKTTTPFRGPQEIEPNEETEQVCARVKKSTADALREVAESLDAKAGKKGKKTSLSYVVGTILEDYAKWYREKK